MGLSAESASSGGGDSGVLEPEADFWEDTEDDPTVDLNSESMLLCEDTLAILEAGGGDDDAKNAFCCISSST